MSDASETSNSYLFYDNVHPTSHGHAVLADKSAEFFIARNLLPPSLDALERWRLLRYGSVQPRGPAADNADPDGNGAPNLLEYAFGGLPAGANGGMLPRVSLASGKFLVQLRRIADPRITYRVEAASDLNGPWVSIWSSRDDANTDGDVEIEETTEFANAPRRFYRVRVERDLPLTR